MTESVVQNSPLKRLPVHVVVAGQSILFGAKAKDGIEPGRQLLPLFPAGTSAANPRLRKSFARLGLPPAQAAC
jgi:hypothetical protein